MYALYPNETDTYISEVEKDRRKQPNLQDKQWSMEIKDEFIDELLKYDYISTKKGRGISSILLNKMGKGQSYKKQRTSNDDK